MSIQFWTWVKLSLLSKASPSRSVVLTYHTTPQQTIMTKIEENIKPTKES